MANLVQQHAQYVDFFMSGRGKKHAGLGHASAVDSVLTGRDIDHSGEVPEDPHAAFMSKFAGYAGVRSAGARPRAGKKLGASLASQFDTVVWGRDVDASGNADETFKKTFGDCSGVRGGCGNSTWTRQRGIALQSTVDSVAFGHDVDGSGEDVQQRHFGTHHSNSAGAPSGERPYGPQKAGYSMKSTVDSVALGLDIDHSGEVPHEHFIKTYPGHAGGVPSVKPERLPKKGAGYSMQCQLDEVIFSRDMDRSGQHAYKSYVEGFCGHAGALSDRRTQRLIKQEMDLRQRTGRLAPGEEAPAPPNAEPTPPPSCAEGSGATALPSPPDSCAGTGAAAQPSPPESCSGASRRSSAAAARREEKGVQTGVSFAFRT